jgi:hypothetical protein
VNEDEREELEQILAELETRNHNWSPHSPTPKQAEFLGLESKEGLYGGAAGGGKSDCLLMGALQHVHIPGYSALLLRRTFPQLKQDGGLIQRSHEWLSGSAAKWSAQDNRWHFPSGATLTFGSLQYERDKFNYQGGAWQFIGFDELTQFTESQYRYLLSRSRRDTGFPVKPIVRASSNPGGVGHDWVKERFVDASPSKKPFVPSRLEDNPHLDQDDYREGLAQLSDVERKQLEQGIWIQDSFGLIYPIRDGNLVQMRPDSGSGWHYVLGVDLGASEIKPTTAYVVQAWHKHTPMKSWALQAFKATTPGPSDIAEQIVRLGAAYNGFTKIVVDEGALGRGYNHEFQHRWAIPSQPAEKNSKAGFRKLLRGAMAKGEAMIVEPECTELVDECGKVLWNELGTDVVKGTEVHVTDAYLYSWREMRAWAAKIKKFKPKHGTPEWAQMRDEEELDQERKMYRREQRRRKRRRL